MSKIDELLKNEKVEWKKVSDVISRYKEKQRDDNKINLVYTVSKDFGIISSLDYWIKNNEDGKYTNYSEDISNYNIIRKNMFAYNPSRLNIGSIDCLFDKPDGVLSPMYVIFRVNESEINPKYLLYYLKSEKVLNLIDSKKEQGARFRFDFERWNYIEIPIPSLETQEKIVKTLDVFTKYVSELKLELEARKKQYEYYRDMLLSEEYLNKLSGNPEILGGGYRLNSTTLGDIGKFTRGNGLQKKDFISYGKPVIHYGQIYTKFNFETDKTISFVNDDVFSKLKKANFNDILIATTSENIEDVGKCVVWLGNEEIGFSGDMYSYCTKENPKYIAYYFQTNKFQKQKEQKVTGTKLIRIHGDDMAKFSITLPPRVIQNKVVEVLDKFQDLLSDTQGLLPEEIEQRQKQYEYYREKLLTFDENMLERERERGYLSNSYLESLKEAGEIVGVSIFNIKKKNLGEVSDIVLGGTPNKTKHEYWENGTIPWMSSGEVNKKKIYSTDNFITQAGYDNSSATMVPANSTVIALAGQGKTRGLVARIKISLSTNQSLATLIPKDIIINDYMYYYLESQYNKLREVSSGDGSRGGLNKEILKRYPIVIPPIPIQEQVVSILDKFDKLVNDINEGLPKEIELRQKQYEYYRERLLNFPK